jgi:hypothetical protein
MKKYYKIMKKISIALWILLLSFGLYAQEQTFTQAIDSVFQFVSRDDVATGILYNRVIPFSGLYKFSASDTSNAGVFKQAYDELYNAALYNNYKVIVFFCK